jgi:hypothetical protein
MNRMKKRGWMGLLVLALALAAVKTASAEALSGDLGVYGSYLDGNDLQDGWGFGAKFKLNMLKFFAVDFRGGYVDFGDRRADLSMIPLEAAGLLQLPLGDAIKLYGGIGVGYYTFQAGGLDLNDSAGYFPGGGGGIGSGQVKFLGEIRWLALSSDVDSTGNELEGVWNGDDISVDGIGLNIGMVIAL